MSRSRGIFSCRSLRLYIRWLYTQYHRSLSRSERREYMLTVLGGRNRLRMSFRERCTVKLFVEESNNFT